MKEYMKIYWDVLVEFWKKIRLKILTWSGNLNVAEIQEGEWSNEAILPSSEDLLVLEEREPKNLKVLGEVLSEKVPTEVGVSIYDEAVDFNYICLTDTEGKLVYNTVFLNLGWDGNFFLSSSSENTKASVPVYHVYSHLTTNKGVLYTQAEKLASGYLKKFEEFLNSNGLDVNLDPIYELKLTLTIFKSRSYKNEKD